MVTTRTRQQTADTRVDAYASTGQISTPMVAALEQAWADIRDRHPDVPPAVVVLGAGSIGAAAVLDTLLHEAAHAVAHVRGIKDTSRHGRYHNTRFKQLAEELGIEVTKDPRIGWSPTDVPEQPRQVYATTIDRLTAALRLHRASEVRESATKPTNPPPCVCECRRRIRAAPSVLDAGPVICGICGANFHREQD